MRAVSISFRKLYKEKCMPIDFPNQRGHVGIFIGYLLPNNTAHLEERIASRKFPLKVFYHIHTFSTEDVFVDAAQEKSKWIRRRVIIVP